MSEVEAKLVRARLQRAELGTKLSDPAAAPPSQVLSLLVAATEQEGDTISDDLRASLQAVIGKLEAEHAAKELARTEAADAATAATVQAASTATATTPATATTAATATAAATTATSNTNPAPAVLPSSHARPPPLLEGSSAVVSTVVSNWPDGSDSLAPSGSGSLADGGLSDAHYELISGATSAELPAVLASLRTTRHAPY